MQLLSQVCEAFHMSLVPILLNCIVSTCSRLAVRVPDSENVVHAVGQRLPAPRHPTRGVRLVACGAPRVPAPAQAALGR